MIRLKDARELVFRANTEDEKSSALDAYPLAVRGQIATDVYATVDGLASELADHGPVVALTLKLAVDRITQVLDA